MANNLTVKKVTHNTISVEWNISGNQEITRSQPFTMISDSHPVAFNVVLCREVDTEILIYSSCCGRAILKLTIEFSNIKQTIMKFIKNWKIIHKLTNFGNLSIDENKVKIHCHITWLGCSKDGNCEAPLYAQRPLFENLASNWGNWTCNVIIDNKKIPAHKGLLSIYSKVLAVMFDTSMEESKKCEVKMKQVECSTMEVILKIIYRRVLDDLDDLEVALKVLKVAEMYQMLGIKLACEIKLQLNIQDDNVLRLLDEAEKHRAFNLFSTCVEYIIARNGKILSHDKLRELAAEKQAVKNAIADLWLSFANDMIIEEM